MNSLTDCFKLSNGVEIPCFGYGTFLTPDGDVCKEGVKSAIKLGYRHIDTAAAYGNEASVSAGIKESGVKREDIFITTKHWIDHRGYEKTIQAVDESLQRLGTDYIDLYLIHWPCVAKVNPNWEEINAETWRGFEDCYKAGKLKAIGVSNFERKHLDALYKTCTVKPMANQIEFHPGWMQKDTVEYSKENGMVVEAYMPLGGGNLLAYEGLKKIADKYGKSVAHICLRWVLQHDILPLCKSVHEERIKTNAEIFDFTISAEDMATIDNFPKLAFTGWVPEEGPADAL